ncbi:MAG: GAF domain-containing protein [Anaerolineaceae bacterium]|nr:GAF domain-containing protein [Anaerolineaceae bacterium]
MTQLNQTAPLSPLTANQPQDHAAQVRKTVRLLAIPLTLFTSVAALAFIVGTSTFGDWQFVVLSIAFFLVSVYSLPLTAGAFQDHHAMGRISLLSIFLSLALLSASILVEDVSLPTALVNLLYGLIAASAFGFHKRSNLWIIYGIVSAATIAVVGNLVLVDQLTIHAIKLGVPIVIAILVMVYITILSLQFVSSSIEIRLTSAFIALVIIPLSISSLVQTQFTLSALRSEITDKTMVTAEQLAQVIDTFYVRNLEIVKDEASLDVLGRYLSEEAPDEQLQNELAIVMRILQTRESEERQYLSSYALLNRQGVNVFDTNASQVGNREGSNSCFTDAFNNNQSVYVPFEFLEGGQSFISYCAPVRNIRRETVGVLRVRYSALVLQRLLQNYTGLLGPYSYAILFDENNLRLADTYAPEITYTFPYRLSQGELSNLVSQNRLPRSTGNTLYFEAPELVRILRSMKDQSINFNIQIPKPRQEVTEFTEIGTLVSLKQLPWKIAYFQAEFDPTTYQKSQIRLTVITAALVALLVSLIGILVSRLISRPLVNLTRVAEKVTQGDLEAQADTSTNDETGALARAFNSMTGRLNQFIAELEQRVAQRTNDLEQQNVALAERSDQLKTVADVARSIVTSQELQALLSSVTHLISERFGYYHVGIFLLDDSRQNAVLRAANSQGGQRMLARQHQLEVGHTGIVGTVTGTAQPRIASNVGADSAYFNNPDLPATRSEMALPLLVNERVIGALDVQSTELNAFSSDDIELFTILADQVAIAIYNNQLYSETARALAEAQNVHRQYLRQEWTRDLSVRRSRAFRYTPQGVVARETDSPDIQEAITTGKPYLETETMPDSTTRAVMAVPIQLRGETIGVIRVQDQGVDRSWSADEVVAVQDVAQQVSVALENARLFEKTVQRAEREKKVLEITGLIRATNDPQQMLEIAAAEIQKALGVTRAQIILSKAKTSDNGNNSDKSGGV